MTLTTNRLIVAVIGMTIVAGLAGCNRQPPEMTKDEFQANRESQAKEAARNNSRK